MTNETGRGSFKIVNPEQSGTKRASGKGGKAKKSFGQHFLTNEDIARRIADSLSGVSGFQSSSVSGERKRVLEVGPGKGMLTKYLLQKDIDLLVVEADQDMVTHLETHFPELHGNIIAQDFLKLNLLSLFSNHQSPITTHQSPIINHQFSIIGNFPYNISSQIVFKMLDNRQLVPELVGMFQKEMAERIIAKPGGKDYGVISVLTQAFYEGKYLFTVGNRNFNPPPKVQSGVIRLLRKDEELGCDQAIFRQVVKATFNQRRKMLRNTMKPFFKDAAVLEGAFFTKRPEELSVQEFVDLTSMVKTESKVDKG